MPSTINKPESKEWYKRGWGLVIAILFFPYFILWYAWAKSNWSKNIKIAVTAVVAIVMLPIMIGMATAEPPDTNSRQQANDNNQISDQTEAVEQPDTEPEQNVEDETETVQPVQESRATIGERNALNKALDYLRYTAFSYSGLIEQLEFEGFTREEAVYGVDNSGADWNEQAELKAQQYMDYSSFSRAGLIEQLEYEGFTRQQAEYGVKAVGY